MEIGREERIGRGKEERESIMRERRGEKEGGRGERVGGGRKEDK